MEEEKFFEQITTAAGLKMSQKLWCVIFFLFRIVLCTSIGMIQLGPDIDKGRLSIAMLKMRRFEFQYFFQYYPFVFLHWKVEKKWFDCWKFSNNFIKEVCSIIPWDDFKKFFRFKVFQMGKTFWIFGPDRIRDID